MRWPQRLDISCWTHIRHPTPHVASVPQTVLSSVAVGFFPLLSADPVLTQFARLSNLSTLCLPVLSTTAVALVRFFQTESHGYGRLQIRVLPLKA